MEEIIAKYSIKCFWHFTDKANLASIKEHGLLSLAQLRARNINIPVPGGNEESHRKDGMVYQGKALDEYVRLCFIDESSMLYVAQQHENRILNSCWLEISCSILKQEGILVSDGIAYAQDSAIFPVTEAKSKIDFEAIFIRSQETYGRRKKAKKAEILIPDCIPLDYITFPN